MFGQLKDLYNLRKQAQEMQKQLESEQVTASSSDNRVTLTLNGAHDLIDVKVSSEGSIDQLASAFKEAYSKAQSQLKSILAEKFKGLM